MNVVPAELLLDRQFDMLHGYKYTWYVYQPDVSGQPIICEGYAYNKQKAKDDGLHNLIATHRKQGHLDDWTPNEIWATYYGDFTPSK